MRRLPETFETLEDLVPVWSLATEELRFHRRVSSSVAELEGFDRRIRPRIEEILDYLNTLKTAEPDDLGAADRSLFDLALMAMEAFSALDLEWETTDIEDAWPVDRLAFLPPSSDRAKAGNHGR